MCTDGAPEKLSVLGGDDAREVVVHDLVEFGDELVRVLGNAVERQQHVGDYRAHRVISYPSVREAASDLAQFSRMRRPR